MKRLVIVTALILIAVAAFPQQQPRPPVYNQRALERLGLSAEEIEEILQIQEEAAADIHRLQADQEIRKAELARLLLDEDPSMRMIERNLRSTAEIEVDIRMVEIRREVAIREIVGTDRWARIVQALREFRAQSAEEVASEAERQLRQLQQAIEAKQREINELIQSGRDAVQDEEVRRLFGELTRQSQELARLLRERLQ